MMHSSLFIPEQPLSLLDTLEAAGEECWVVGGCVRDSLMGKTPSDWDMTTSATPQRMQQIFSDRSLLLAGVEHGTVGVIWDGKVYEITTYRVESGSGDHRHPDSLHFSSKIEDDLARRDLTINAMAYHPQRGLLDCFGGQQDLHDRVIRSVGPALLRFEEDALRILRVLRFQAVLGFTVEEQTEQAIARKAPLLDCISVERIWSELQKLLVAPFAHLALQGRREVWQVVLPEWQKAQGQDRLDTLPQDAFLRLIWLCCAADCSPVGAMKRLKCPRQQQQRAAALWELWQQPPQGIYPLRQALFRYGRGLVEDHLALCAAASKADGQTKEQFARACDGCWNLSQLNINGKKLMDLGCPPGKAVGELLEQLLEKCLQDRLENTSEQLEQAAEGWLKRRQG